ncbi:RidA family protein [Photobacterium iliopiscarium]|jgi:2-iminobutanoate/2-iminopropanoate deaminase|uniref:RidA family protein n=1 Tax=Photobacterium iliopiscarium TaxID=56192 RepID=A0A2T3MA84_9GAMM|nr:RidA family protein [Photobacterium iliopiscarium]KJG13147.1 regulator [Photobacterium iliopiscarium]PST97321.1 RidA family protein [Photobacterium iliopiscarium]PSU01748.1 RidA family protein [Photobacterium iliopiscarium]PSV84096.1 RidA family protein [Photobacterium iliopiscarium]PSV89810.1 RidA family protein [Photobacterium iliopiscarium]
MSKVITSKTAPDAIGPYSHGNVFGNLIFTSGQLPVCKEKGGIVDGGVAEQSYQSLVNLRSVIEAGGGDLNTVVKTTCYLANIGDFAAFNEVYAQFFKTECPARSCFAVKDLPMGALVEIEAIAYRK